MSSRGDLGDGRYRHSPGRGWWVPAVAALLGGLVGAAYALLVPPTFVARGYLIVVSSTAGEPGGTSYAQAYARLVRAPAVLAAGSADARPMPGLARRVTASASPDTPVIEVTGRAGTPAGAAKLANLAADGLVRFADDHTDATRVRLAVLSQAYPPAEPAAPSRPVSVLIGVTTGLLLGALSRLARSAGSAAAGRAARRPGPDSGAPGGFRAAAIRPAAGTGAGATGGPR